MPDSSTETPAHPDRGVLRQFLGSQWMLLVEAAAVLPFAWYVARTWQDDSWTGGKATLAILAFLFLCHAVWTTISWVRGRRKASEERLLNMEASISGLADRVDRLDRLWARTEEAGAGPSAESGMVIRYDMAAATPCLRDYEFWPHEGQQGGGSAKGEWLDNHVMKIPMPTAPGMHGTYLEHFGKETTIPARSVERRSFMVTFYYKATRPGLVLTIVLCIPVNRNDEAKYTGGGGIVRGRDRRLCADQIKIEFGRVEGKPHHPVHAG